MQEGYFGVVLPQIGLWQGFYLDGDFRAKGEKFVKDTHNFLLKHDFPIDGNNPKVVTPLPGFSQNETEQMLLGALTAVLCDRTNVRDLNGIGSAAYALRLVTGNLFFLVTGKDVGTGFTTDYRKLKATTIDAAREEIKASPEVMACQALNLLRK